MCKREAEWKYLLAENCHRSSAYMHGSSIACLFSILLEIHIRLYVAGRLFAGSGRTCEADERNDSVNDTLLCKFHCLPQKSVNIKYSKWTTIGALQSEINW